MRRYNPHEVSEAAMEAGDLIPLIRDRQTRRDYITQLKGVQDVLNTILEGMDEIIEMQDEEEG